MITLIYFAVCAVYFYKLGHKHGKEEAEYEFKRVEKLNKIRD